MSAFELINYPSPNHDERPAPPDMVVLHYTGMKSGQAALERLCSAEAKVSAHYLVYEDGSVFQMVPEERRAWHAGVSHWAGVDGVNSTSIGIEIVNPGHEWGYRAFPEAQMQSVVALLRGICERWSVPITRIVGHSDIAPDRKEDPGELFPWKLLAGHGLAIGPYPGSDIPDQHPDYETCLQMLREIGYRVEGTHHTAPVLAFQRRFCPAALGQGLNGLTRSAIFWAHKQFRNP